MSQKFRQDAPQRFVGPSVTKLGDFLMFLATNFNTKIAKIFGDLIGCFEKYIVLSKNGCGYFQGTLATF